MTLPLHIRYAHGEVYRQGTTMYYVQLIWDGGCQEIEADNTKELKQKVEEFVNELKTEE